MAKVAVIDDDPVVNDLLSDFLSSEGHEVTKAKDGREGLEVLKKEVFDVVFLDLKLPGIDGLQILERSKETINSHTPVVIITAHGSIDTAVRAMQLGALDYITKPFRLEETSVVVKKALEFKRLKEENVSLRKQIKERYATYGIIGTSPKMQEVFSLIDKIADTDSTVLITGESGTGKELVARTIHYNSSRSENNFVPINCGAIPKDLLESELFGHEKGAFTGAVSTRIGRFELANGGTIFLDEVGELAPELQVKLLRVLQEREFERVGGIKTIKVDVRIIAATNKDLESLVESGQFREDLYYRLNVIPLHLPPLRERKDDIPLLVEHFIEKHALNKGRQRPNISPEILGIFMQYHWPGNVRELENVIERLCILASGRNVEIQDLPERLKNLSGTKPSASISEIDVQEEIELTPKGIDLNRVINEIETKLILQALEMTGGNKTRASKLLGLNRTTLIEKMKKKGLLQKSKK
ncbi:MAG: sigma-54-dependent Fis family transcriptional regulator [Nitrospirae bacterium]|nr:MAG: sigma-54-dependent Fis family transcriptional regulator [Nitrospirota bacterium]